MQHPAWQHLSLLVELRVRLLLRLLEVRPTRGAGTAARAHAAS
jgi:hypothetical protein